MSYECAGGSLKLKGVSEKSIKKKKKKSKSDLKVKILQYTYNIWYYVRSIKLIEY
jgi:hypothetical protein